MSDAVYPAPTRELADRRAELAPETHDAFQAFSRQVFGAYAHSAIALDAIGAGTHDHHGS